MSAKFLILRRIQRDIITHVHGSSGKVTVILVRFEQNLNLFDRFSKNTQISKCVKIRSVGAELFHADRQADRQTHDEASSRFPNFAKSPKK